jgi:hypothetical protein
LHPSVTKSNRPKPLNVNPRPWSTRLNELYPIKPKLCLDPILGPYTISYELSTATNYLPMIALLQSRYPNTLEHPLGQKIRQFTAVSPIRLDPITILLRQKARRGDNTVRPIGHQSIMKPKPKIARLIYNVDGISPIPI